MQSSIYGDICGSGSPQTIFRQWPLWCGSSRRMPLSTELPKLLIRAFLVVLCSLQRTQGTHTSSLQEHEVSHINPQLWPEELCLQGWQGPSPPRHSLGATEGSRCVMCPWGEHEANPTATPLLVQLPDHTEDGCPLRSPSTSSPPRPHRDSLSCPQS